MKKRIVTIALLVVMTIGTFTTMALATTPKDLQAGGHSVQIALSAAAREPAPQTIVVRGTRALGAQAGVATLANQAASAAGGTTVILKEKNRVPKCSNDPIGWWTYRIEKLCGGSSSSVDDEL